MAHHKVAYKAVLICLVYAVLSILQTLNSRFLYKNLHFDYYSFIFSIQKITNIIVFYMLGIRKFDTKHLIHMLPCAGFTCLSNVISSYCLTIMPLAAYMSFKKLVILFVLGVSLALRIPANLNQTQYICMIGIVVGGIMVGQKDILTGQTKGYIACMGFNLFEALSIQYAAYLYKAKGFSPSDLLMYNSIISLPYYASILLYEQQMPSIVGYFETNTNFLFLFILIASIFLACTSELAGNYIIMKISPFQKAIVSNIKDLILVIISVQWLFDFKITVVSGIGIGLCLVGSLIFSVPVLSDQSSEKNERIKDSDESKKLMPEDQMYGEEDEKVDGLNEQIDDRSTE